MSTEQNIKKSQFYFVYRKLNQMLVPERKCIKNSTEL